MPSENVELARRLVQAMNSRDVDALDDLAHPDLEFDNRATLGGGVYRGIGAVKTWLEGFFDAWQTYSMDPERVIEAGEIVVVLAHARAEGKASGVTLEAPRAYVNTFRDGRLARTQVFLDHDEALKAVGLTG